jgi:hypothetical protein
MIHLRAAFLLALMATAPALAIPALAIPALATPATAAPAKSHAKPAPQQPWAVTGWASLDPTSGYAARTGLIRNLNTTPPPDSTENVFVYARRGGNKELNWREDLRSSGSTYEASNSDAAFAPHASYPEWDNPDEERLMSNAKDALGLCGAILTCPGKN